MAKDGGQPARILVAGAGLIGRAHIERILREPEARLVGIVDVSPEAESQAARLGVPFGGDLARMLDSGKVEAMVVFQPPKDWTTVDSPGADAGKTFDSRYFLLHAGNRDEMQRRYPGAFR